MSILQILEEIAAISSTKAKEAILKREEKNLLLRKVFEAAYNKLISYHVKKIPKWVYVPSIIKSGLDLNDAITHLNKFSSRELTGNAAIEYLSALLGALNDEDAIVIERIIDRDLRCGCSDSIASRVWPGLVPVFDVMLCDKDMSRIKYPAFAQTKCLSEDWEIENEIGQKFKIKDVVDQKLKLNVKSFDTKTSTICYNPIIRWLNNGVKHKLSVIIYKDANGNICKSKPLTSDHILWCESRLEWIAVRDLNSGDLLL